MNAQEIYGEVKKSGKYRNIFDETVKRLCAEEVIKYKKSRDAVKSVKNKLHQLSNSFLKHDISLNKLPGSAQELTNALEEAAKNHSSTSERIGFYNDLYGDILGRLGGIRSVLDIASGINPLLLIRYCKEKNILLESLYAYDINLDAVGLVNEACRMYEINGWAEGADLLISIPHQKADLALLFKIVPLLEQQRKGYYKEVIDRLNVRYIAVTFPTKTMSAKSVGMSGFYRRFFNSYLGESGYNLVLEKEYCNELLFVIDKEAG